MHILLVKGPSVYDIINFKILRKGISRNKSNYTVNVKKIPNHKYVMKLTKNSYR